MSDQAGEHVLRNKGLAKVYVALLLALGIAVGIAELYVVVQVVLPGFTPPASPTPEPSVTPKPFASPTTSPSPTPTETPSSQHTPTPTWAPVVRRVSNWAGYIVATATDLHSAEPNVTEVSASWTVPTVQPAPQDLYSAVWIGIGGEFDSTLIQCGTRQDSVGGQTTYSAWYELLPGNSVRIRQISISPGDQMQATIKLADVTSDSWFLNITDVTTGRSFQNTFTYASSQLSAEWILERPNVNNVLSSLADFDKVTFTNCTATIGTQKGDINSFPALQIVMYRQIATPENAQQLADVSPVSENGAEFFVIYQGTH